MSAEPGTRRAVTKRKSDRAGEWVVVVSGKATDLTITKGEPPRWGRPQMYDVMKGEDWLFESRSVGRAIDILETVIGEA